MLNNEIEVGTLVEVCFDKRRNPINAGARKYDGWTFRVSKAKGFGASGSYYELDGAVTGAGVPYSFMANDLKSV